MRGTEILRLAAVAYFVTVGLAYATPPRYVSISDTPIAVSPTHLFLFRTVGDNEGSHYIEHITRFLVAQELSSGAVTDQWLLGEVRETLDGDDQKANEMIKTGERLDLMGLLAAQGAIPVVFSAESIWREGTLELDNPYRLTGDGLLRSERTAETSMASPVEIRARMAASLNPTMDIMPDELGPVDPIIYDENAYSRDLFDCFVQGYYANTPGHKLLSLVCENSDFSVVSYSVFLTIPNKD